MREHTVPQVIQFESVFKGDSHPLDGLLSQFPKPPLQDVSKQVPDEQSDVPCARLQSIPHDPQLEFVFKGVSHPFEVIRSQSCHPELHDVI